MPPQRQPDQVRDHEDEPEEHRQAGALQVVGAPRVGWGAAWRGMLPGRARGTSAIARAADAGRGAGPPAPPPDAAAGCPPAPRWWSCSLHHASAGRGLDRARGETVTRAAGRPDPGPRRWGPRGRGTMPPVRAAPSEGPPIPRARRLALAAALALAAGLAASAARPRRAALRGGRPGPRRRRHRRGRRICRRAPSPGCRRAPTPRAGRCSREGRQPRHRPAARRAGCGRQGGRTLLTRTQDLAGGDRPYTTETADLKARTDLANAAGAELFVSIHNNALSRTASGTETYHFYYSSPSARLLAQPTCRPSWSPRSACPTAASRARASTCCATPSMPAILVEGAFLTNPSEALLLADPNVRQRIAEAVGRGIAALRRAGVAAPPRAGADHRALAGPARAAFPPATAWCSTGAATRWAGAAGWPSSPASAAAPLGAAGHDRPVAHPPGVGAAGLPAGPHAAPPTPPATAAGSPSPRAAAARRHGASRPVISAGWQHPLARRGEPRPRRSPRTRARPSGRPVGAPRARRLRGPASASTSRPPTGRIRWSCSSSSRPRGCPSWCPSATAGCSSRRSPSTAARPRIMASDLARAPRSGFTVQACGDAHLSNFGVFASRERRLVFDINDFDETLPGPWEWDVKRLAASMLIGARDNGFSTADQERIVLGTAAAVPHVDGALRRDEEPRRLVRAHGDHRAGRAGERRDRARPGAGTSSATSPRRGGATASMRSRSSPTRSAASAASSRTFRSSCRSPSSRRRPARTSRGRLRRILRQLPAIAPARPARAARPVPPGRRGAQGGGGGQRRDATPGSRSSWAATTTTR